MRGFRLEQVIILVLFVVGSCSRDSFKTLVAYEAKQRLTAELENQQYHLLPFRILGEAQHFLQTPQTDELVSVEVVVHWIGENSSLSFPSFDLTQKIRLIIQEEAMSSIPTKAVFTRQFLTQTGFKMNMTGGKRYRWRVESSAKTVKLVQIAISNRQLLYNQTATKSVRKHFEQIAVLAEMKNTLEKVKQSRAEKYESEVKVDVSSMWAWMSSVQMLSLVGLVLMQLTLFEKMMFSSSVV